MQACCTKNTSNYFKIDFLPMLCHSTNMKYWTCRAIRKSGMAKFFVKNIFFVVDDKDVNLVLESSWSIQHGYVVATRGKLHRLITDAKRGEIVDHVNGNTLDNRRQNLRIVSHQQNAINQSGHRISTSKYKGVFWNQEKGKWQATIKHDGKTIHLGWYKIEREAAIAYNAAAKVLFREYRRNNVVTDLSELRATIYRRLKDHKVV